MCFSLHIYCKTTVFCALFLKRRKHGLIFWWKISWELAKNWVSGKFCLSFFRTMSFFKCQKKAWYMVDSSLVLWRLYFDRHNLTLSVGGKHSLGFSIFYVSFSWLFVARREVYAKREVFSSLHWQFLTRIFRCKSAPIPLCDQDSTLTDDLSHFFRKLFLILK